MYYIVAGEEICYAVRGPKEIADEVLNQEIYNRAFNYDDEEIWSDEALDLERERVFRDEYALTALDVLQRLPKGTRTIICRQGQDKYAAPLTADARPDLGQSRRLRSNLRKTIDSTEIRG